ncbi:MAG: hypothetical protein V3S31_02440 [Dehalococcoidia bacterium]
MAIIGTASALRAAGLVTCLLLVDCAALADPDATPTAPSACEQFIAAAEAIELITTGVDKDFTLREAVAFTAGEDLTLGLRCGPWPSAAR